MSSLRPKAVLQRLMKYHKLPFSVRSKLFTRISRFARVTASMVMEVRASAVPAPPISKDAAPDEREEEGSSTSMASPAETSLASAAPTVAVAACVVTSSDTALCSSSGGT